MLTRPERYVVVAGLLALVWPAIDAVRWRRGRAVFNH